MEKESLISKLNIKDYNNQLEKILTNKPFSEDIKSLLLTMLYKVENAYEDYSLVSGNTKTKKETLEEILQIILNDCDSIEIVNDKKSKVILKEKKIITYLNARKMLYQIFEARQEKIDISKKYSIIGLSLQETLNQGYSIASNEIIRDFDGWSWNIVFKEIENITANFIYQTLRILTSDDFYNNLQKDEGDIDKLLDKLNNKYKENLTEKLFKTISQISILNVVNSNKQEKLRLIRIQEELQQRFDMFYNKKEYLEDLKEKKKQIVECIKKIDKQLNNDKELKREFIKRNELLEINNRIFSLSDLAQILEEERNNLMVDLNKYSKKMEPFFFIKEKTEVENKLNLIKEINLNNDDKKTYNIKVKELLKLAYRAICVDIEKVEEKEEIIKLIYKIRYYGLIYVLKNKQVRDIIDVNDVQRMIITKACKKRIITIFSKNIKENYDIIKNILQIDIIELEKMYFKFIKTDNNMILQIYDEGNISKVIEMPNIQELNIKLNKKVKVFI